MHVQASKDAGNENNGASNASEANLQIFLDTFVCQSNQLGVKYFFFEFFDEEWKDQLYGGVEGHWGLFYQKCVVCPLQLRVLIVSQQNPQRYHHSQLPNLRPEPFCGQSYTFRAGLNCDHLLRTIECFYETFPTFSCTSTVENCFLCFLSCSDSLSLRRITWSLHRPHLLYSLWTIPISHSQICSAFFLLDISQFTHKTLLNRINHDLIMFTLLDLIAASCKCHVAIGNSRSLGLSFHSLGRPPGFKHYDAGFLISSPPNLKLGRLDVPSDSCDHGKQACLQQTVGGPLSHTCVCENFAHTCYCMARGGTLFRTD